jgi:predicted RecA/RadA family phage recombinase
MSKQAIEYQKGGTIDVLLTAPVVSGAVIPLYGMIGVATTAGEVGEMIAVDIEKVWTINARTSDVIVVGTTLFWDDGNKELTKIRISNTPAGKAVSTKGAVAGTVNIKLNI